MSKVTLILTDAWASFRVLDALDILVVAAFLYALISWLKEARSRFVLMGLGALALVYLGARALQLTLTLALFQAAITIALVAVVVIFQEEIRRAFERIARSGTLWDRKPDVSTSWIEPILSALAILARTKTGALLVLTGREPLDRHLSGGVVLGARPSEALLLSIFDTHSPGHDGAVIMIRGELAAFGVRLPLSDHVEGAKFGTRHTAALGLSERSDALVLVVSEERGVISLAKDGKLRQGVPLSAVREALESHLRPQIHTPTRAWWLDWLTRKLGTKVISLVGALVIWILVVGHQGPTGARTFVVPVTYKNLSSTKALDPPSPLEMQVTLSGTEPVLRRVRTEDLAVVLDASELTPGNKRIAITDRHVLAPHGVSVDRVQPEFVTVVVHETVLQQLKVKPKTEGSVRRGLLLQEIAVNPTLVQVLVRKNTAGSLTSLSTQSIDLSSMETTTTLLRELDLPSGVRLAEGQSSEVGITVRIVPELARVSK